MSKIFYKKGVWPGAEFSPESAFLFLDLAKRRRRTPVLASGASAAATPTAQAYERSCATAAANRHASWPISAEILRRTNGIF